MDVPNRAGAEMFLCLKSFRHNADKSSIASHVTVERSSSSPACVVSWKKVLHMTAGRDAQVQKEGSVTTRVLVAEDVVKLKAKDLEMMVGGELATGIATMHLYVQGQVVGRDCFDLRGNDSDPDTCLHSERMARFIDRAFERAEMRLMMRVFCNNNAY